MTGGEGTPSPLFYGLVPRLLSFFLALAVTFWVLAVPTDFAGPEGDVDHRALLALMWGLAAGYTHGVGFIPRNRILRVLLGPLAAWGLLVGGGWWFLARG